MTPEMASEIQRYRARIMSNEITREEMIAAIKALRADRTGAAVASEKSKVKRASAAKVVDVDANDLLDGFL